MAKIDSRGLVDDGSANLLVQGRATVGTLQHTAQTLAGAGAVTIANPGFYYVPASGTAGEGLFTGSVPAPSSCPGSMLTMVDTLGSFSWLLSGSAYLNGKALFIMASGSLPGGLPAAYGGGKVTMSPLGSIIMMSDGYHWCILGGSGSMTLAGNNL